MVPKCAGLATASDGRCGMEKGAYLPGAVPVGLIVLGTSLHHDHQRQPGIRALSFFPSFREQLSSTETLIPPGFPVRYMVTLRSAALAAACILVPLVSGAAAGILTMSGIAGWYATLNKPWFTPPNYVFGPVCTVLYILMGISLYLVLSQGWEKKPVKHGVVLFAAQLVANILWSFLFFGFHSPVAGLACILVLLALIVGTMVAFRRVSRTAALLLVPYLAWVCIATALNAAIVLLN
jgi:translocator protein